MAKVKHILERKSADVESIDREATALDAARQMNQCRIGSLVVTDGELVVGIVTERDILRRVVAAERDPVSITVHAIMSAPVACCRLETDLEECRTVMAERRIRRLPVVEEGVLKGIVTAGDLLAFELTSRDATIEYLNEYLYSPGAPRGA